MSFIYYRKFVNWDVNFAKIDKKKVNEKVLDILKYTDTETVKMAKLLINNCLSHSRANDYTQWIELGWVCRNIDNNLLDV